MKQIYYNDTVERDAYVIVLEVYESQTDYQTNIHLMTLLVSRIFLVLLEL